MAIPLRKKSEIEEIKNKISGMDAILIGPGLGTSQTARNILEMLFQDDMFSCLLLKIIEMKF